MIRGKVVGEVWATRKAKGLSDQKLLLVAAEKTDRLVVAIDTIDAGVGDEVLVSWGSGARNVLRAGPDNKDLLCDAAISLVVDGCSDRDEIGELKETDDM
ncbi:MAG: EutN/CcmL family microcompartment protein [Pseudomonadota bacterium]